MGDSESNVNANLEEYTCGAFDQTLLQLYAELRIENGDDYEPDSLKMVQAAIETYFKAKVNTKSIIRGRELIRSRKSSKRRPENLDSKEKENDRINQNVWPKDRKS